jgi:hypothetical protein
LKYIFKHAKNKFKCMERVAVQLNYKVNPVNKSSKQISMSKNWIPEKELEYVAMCRKWVQILRNETLITAYKWDATLCSKLQSELEAYINARNAYEEVDSTANRTAKNTLRKSAAGSMREFANSSVRYNRDMDASARMEMGIKSPDNTPTPAPRPVAMPDTLAENTAYHYQHRVRAMNVETARTNKPAGVYGVRFAWQVGGERPSAGVAMLQGKFSRKPTIIVQHQESDKGTPAWYSSCYENSRGEAGPWSPVVEMYIA